MTVVLLVIVLLPHFSAAVKIPAQHQHTFLAASGWWLADWSKEGVQGGILPVLVVVCDNHINDHYSIIR